MDVVTRLAAAIDALRPEARVAVGIDGPDAAGKSMLAGGLAERLRRPVLCATVDGWHHPRAFRLRQGDESPVGYYEDSFDHGAMIHELLQPFRAGATTLTTAWFDHAADEPRRVDASGVAPTAALLVDGVFLLRPELRELWDLRIYLHVPEQVTVARALERDAFTNGGADSVRRRYERRYLPGQAHYREIAAPLDHADVVLDSSDPASPVVVRWGSDFG